MTVSRGTFRGTVRNSRETMGATMPLDGCNGSGPKRSIAGYCLYVFVNDPRNDSQRWETVPGTFRLDATEAQEVGAKVAAQRPDALFGLDVAEEPLH